MAAGLSREFVGGCSAGNPRLSQRGSRFPRRIIRACKLCILAYSLYLSVLITTDKIAAFYQPFKSVVQKITLTAIVNKAHNSN